MQANDNRKQLRDIENKITDHSSSKVLANEITEKQNIVNESGKKIDDSRSPFQQVAPYAGVLFFAISELCAVNHMYHQPLLQLNRP